MGLSQSKAKPEDFEFPPPIQTRDELLQRHASHQANYITGLDSERQHWFTQMFDTFCTRTESTKFWSEGNLADFMRSVLPQNPELTPVLMDAIPIMHRCLLRLGSYPYQNDPEEFLTHDVLRTAIIFVARSFYKLFADFTGILYQCMARLDREKIRKKERDADDDTDLNDVLSLLRNRRRDPDNPKSMIQGPRHPPASHFPSSWSTDFEQGIPRQEFRSFLRLMLVLNPYYSGIDVDNFANLTTLTEVERVTDCMLSTFFRSGSSVDDSITFGSFKSAIDNDMPCLLLGWLRILGPLACPRPLPHGEFPSSKGLPTFLREAYLPYTRREVPASGFIFNLPVLSQLGCMLPKHIPSESISIASSAKADQLHDLDDLSRHIAQSPPMVFLVSGRNSQDDHLTFGLFDSKGYSGVGQTTRAFQLKPVHRVFGSLENRESFSIRAESTEDGKSVLVGRLTTKYQAISLVIDTEGIGRFTVQGPYGCASVDEGFSVDAVELLQSDKKKVIVRDFSY